MFNFYNYFLQYQPPTLWGKGSDDLEFTPVNIANPLLFFLQQRYNINFLISDVYAYVSRIANNEIIVFDTPPNSYVLTDTDKIEFLSYIGNIVGLPIFVLPAINGFVLDVAALDINKLGSNNENETISAQEYANCLLARFYKFQSNTSINNIINSVGKAAQLSLSDMTVTISGDTINFTLPSNSARTQLFIDYLDPKGYNLWMKPTSGLVTFTYV